MRKWTMEDLLSYPELDPGVQKKIYSVRKTPAIYDKIFKSKDVADVVSAIVYWNNWVVEAVPQQQGWFYKTYESWKEDLSIDRRKMIRIKNHLEKLGVITIRKQLKYDTGEPVGTDNPALNYWKLNGENLKEIIEQHLEYGVTYKMGAAKRSSGDGESVEESNIINMRMAVNGEIPAVSNGHSAAVSNGHSAVCQMVTSKTNNLTNQSNTLTTPLYTKVYNGDFRQEMPDGIPTSKSTIDTHECIHPAKEDSNGPDQVILDNNTPAKEDRIPATAGVINLEQNKEQSYTLKNKEMSVNNKNRVPPAVGIPASNSPRPPMSGKPTKKGARLSHDEVAVLDLVEYWNNLDPIPKTPEYSTCPKLTRHKVDPSGMVSKTVKEICKRLVIITQGKFNETFPDVQFYEDVTPNSNFIDHTFTKEELRQIMKAYRMYFDPDKFPSDKSRLSSSMLDFLGCVERTYKEHGVTVKKMDNRSWFHQVVHTKIKEIENISRQRASASKYEDLHTQLVLALPKGRDTPRIASQLATELFSFYERSVRITKYLYKDYNGKWFRILGSFENFYEPFIKMVTSKFDRDQLYPKHFSSRGVILSEKYPYAVEQAYDIELIPTAGRAKVIAKSRIEHLVRNGSIEMDDVLRNENGDLLYYLKSEQELIESGEILPWWNI